MLIHYTPDQELLFDQSVRHWVEARKTPSRLENARVYLHTSRKASLHVVETHDSSEPFTYLVHNADLQLIACVAAPDQGLGGSGLRGLLCQLRHAFSAEHRRDLATLVHGVGFQLLLQGRGGDHILRWPDDRDPEGALSVVDAQYAIVDLDLPPEITALAPGLRQTPVRTNSTNSVLSFGMTRPYTSLSLPATAHGRIAMIQWMQATYGWARPAG